MKDINLLPIEFSPSSPSLKTSVKIKMLVVFFGIVFVFVALGGGGAILFFSSQIQQSVSRQNSLKRQIQFLQSTEQQLFLVKDRIEKIKNVEAQSAVDDHFNTLSQKVISVIPVDITVKSINIDPSQTDFTVTSQTSVGMATFLNSLVTNGTYKNLSLTSFSFLPEAGYSVSLRAI